MAVGRAAVHELANDDRRRSDLLRFLSFVGASPPLGNKIPPP
jgi:hypothetical protein